jgi:hypothetical protein
LTVGKVKVQIGEKISKKVTSGGINRQRIYAIFSTGKILALFVFMFGNQLFLKFLHKNNNK